MHSKTVSTMPALSCLVKPVAFASSSINSGFLISQIPWAREAGSLGKKV